MGLSFSVPQGTKVPPSLKNIYLALENDPLCKFKMPSPIHGDLTNWAKQGVFLLNAVLTVIAGKSNAHKDQGWEEFTDAAIKGISAKNKNIVFMLWGGFAQKKAALIDSSKHLILNNVHPSPMAGTSFKVIKDFSKANEYLEKNGKTPINWSL